MVFQLYQQYLNRKKGTTIVTCYSRHIISGFQMSSFHPIEKEKFLTICENKFIIWDLGNGGLKEVLSRTIDQKGEITYVCNILNWTYSE